MTNHTTPTPQPVAVLIPFYYRERLDWLQQAIDSITTQRTDRPVRVYLGIDGPLHPDLNTFLVRNRPVLHKIVHNEINQGLAVMLNRMIDALESEPYIFRMDADDVSLPGRLQLQLDFMEAHPDIDISGGAIIESDFQPDGYRQTIRYPLTHSTIAERFHRRSPIAHPTCCFRADVFTNGYRYPTEATYNEDLGLWLRLIGDGIRFGNLPEPLLEFRIQPDFYRKRGYVKAVIEFRLYWESLRTLNQPFHSRFFPLMRFLFRITPTPIKKLGYRSSLRKYL
jgi:glycosyltransferase involved in cell wall biosynthesis